MKEIQVPPAHRHPHQGILSTILLVLGIFGLLSIVLSSLLAANAVASFLAREKRSIGILKTLGLPGMAIQALVLIPLACTGILATALGLPLGLVAAPALTRTVAELLNFSIASPTPASWAVILPFLLGLLVPLALGLPLALRAQRLSIVEALNDQGTEKTRFAGAKGARISGRRFAVLEMSLRNAVRRKKRLVLSLLLMGMGGGLFLTATNLTLSWRTNLKESLAARKFDYQLRLGSQPSSEDIARLRVAVPDIDSLELWRSLPVSSVSREGVAVDITYPDEAHGSFRAYAVPNDTAMLRFPLMKGSWRRNPGEVVLNQSAMARFPGTRIDDTVRLSLGGVIRDFRLRGVVKELGQAAAYLDPAEWKNFLPGSEDRTELVLSLAGRTDQASVQAHLAVWTEERNLPLEVLVSSQEYQVGGTEHFSLLITLILFMGLITGAVGMAGCLLDAQSGRGRKAAGVRNPQEHRRDAGNPRGQPAGGGYRHAGSGLRGSHAAFAAPLGSPRGFPRKTLFADATADRRERADGRPLALSLHRRRARSLRDPGRRSLPADSPGYVQFLTDIVDRKNEGAHHEKSEIHHHRPRDRRGTDAFDPSRRERQLAGAGRENARGRLRSAEPETPPGS